MKDARKFLTFCLGAEHYGIDILNVREIIGLIAITPLPHTPDYVRGVMNLRGRIIPVLDLRRRFGLPDAMPTKETCVVVVESADAGNEVTLTGLVVDSVREVMDIPASAIEPPPEFGSAVPLHYIQGVGKSRDRMILLMNASAALDARTAATTAATDVRRAA